MCRHRTSRIFTCCAAVSLVLCAGSMALWVRSRSTGQNFAWHGSRAVQGAPQTAWTMTGNRGSMIIVRFDNEFAGPMPADFATPAKGRFERQSYAAYDTGGPSGPFGFGYSDARQLRPIANVPGVTASYRWRTLTAPLWAVVALFGVLPAVWVWRNAEHRRVARRLSEGRCTACGYDLRGTPGGRCPECGAAGEP